jgi:hypothetical protein
VSERVLSTLLNEMDGVGVRREHSQGRQMSQVMEMAGAAGEPVATQVAQISLDIFLCQVQWNQMCVFRLLVFIFVFTCISVCTYFYIMTIVEKKTTKNLGLYFSADLFSKTSD